jgi:RNA polymerase sigma-70 factor (ECF subfamily)
MHLRRGKRWACEQQTDDGDVEAAGPKPDRRRAENVMVSQLDLERAIEKISPGCRTVFILHDIDGFEHKDISRLLGISEGTSKSQLHDARMKLRKLLITSTQMSSV